MKPSLAPREISRAKARNALLLNQLATPGLGSLVARRWFEGAGQLLLALAGFALILLWFAREMAQLYDRLNGTGETRPSGSTILGGTVLFSLAWLWSLFTSLSLLRASAKAPQPIPENSFSVELLEESAVLISLATVPQWKRSGGAISRTFQFQDFPAAIKFVNAVAALAEAAQHHPDLDVRWNRVALVFTTHSAGGLTEKDFGLARQCDALAAQG